MRRPARCTHLLKIVGYSRTKGLGAGNSINSGTFNVGGHTWCIRYYPDGFSKDYVGWMSVDIYLVRPASQNDVVKARVSFCVLDQDGRPYLRFDRKLHNGGEPIITFSAAGSAPWGLNKFVVHGYLMSSKECLRDDCFVIRCDVTIINFDVCKDATRKQYVTVPPSDLHLDLGWLLLSENGKDVVFEVGGKRFSAHRNILAARSPVFKVELYGPMKENEAAPIKIEDMEAVVFRALLQFIYTDSLPAMDEAGKIVMAQHLLVAADRYDLKRLKLICEDMLCSHINESNVATTLVLAEQHGLHGLKEACFAFLISPGNLKAVRATEGYNHLRSSCPSILDELVAKLAP